MSNRFQELLPRTDPNRECSIWEGLEHFQGAFEHSAIGIALVGLDGMMLEVNRAMCRFFRAEAAYLKSKNFRDLTHPEDLASDLHEVQRLLQGDGDTFNLEKRYIRPDGSYFWALLTVSLVKNHQGKPLHFISQVQDITERKHHEVRLQELQRRFTMAVEAGQIGIWDWDLNTNLCRLSKELIQIYGWPPERDSIQFSEWGKFLPTADFLRLETTIRQSLSNKESFETTFHFSHSDGSLRLLKAKGGPVCDSEGQPSSMTGVCWDITAQEAMAERLRTNEARLRLATKISEIGIWEYDLIKQEVYWDDVACAIHGLQRASNLLSPERTFALIHPEDQARVQAHFEQCVNTETPYELDHRIVTPAGQIRHIRATGYCVRDSNGVPFQAVGTMMDITQEKTIAEELARARDAANAANRMKSDFIARMSHEIRTPMNAILAPAQLLAHSGLKESERELVRMISCAGEHLLKMINNILDFSKLEAGKLELQEEIFCLETLLNETVGPFEILMTEKAIALELQVDPQAAGHWQGDASRIKQILLNLLSNAIKFTHQGRIRLEVYKAERGRLRFTVEDTGCGFLEKDNTRVFEPFEQGISNGMRGPTGTGLGLAICHELVELMQGQIDYFSKPGEGSTFWFELPLQRAHRSSASVDRMELTAAEVLSQRQTPPRVLVVEDNASNRKVATLLLTKLGCQVSTAENGLEAVHAVRNTTFDMILMDCEMPLMDGYASSSQILQLRAPPPPIIALSAHANAEHREHCFQSGMKDILTKPIQIHELADMIAKWMPPEAKS